ncbi:hypothetical protein CLV40_14411 [Actinokineospora auranticolor]|uniref:Uncharacterized protein n=1 Tax=Actinokineospora auranticolor TaxID=155976 RepID=A0A2S6GBF8_9PSEU|nr:hypothetical protein CLV40_14411 [Actinokineospora auranticolor]
MPGSPLPSSLCAQPLKNQAAHPRTHLPQDTRPTDHASACPDPQLPTDSPLHKQAATHSQTHLTTTRSRAHHNTHAPRRAAPTDHVPRARLTNAHTHQPPRPASKRPGAALHTGSGAGTDTALIRACGTCQPRTARPATNVTPVREHHLRGRPRARGTRRPRPTCSALAATSQPRSPQPEPRYGLECTVPRLRSTRTRGIDTAPARVAVAGRRSLCLAPSDPGQSREARGTRRPRTARSATTACPPGRDRTGRLDSARLGEEAPWVGRGDVGSGRPCSSQRLRPRREPRFRVPGRRPHALHLGVRHQAVDPTRAGGYGCPGLVQANARHRQELRAANCGEGVAIG